MTWICAYKPRRSPRRREEKSDARNDRVLHRSLTISSHQTKIHPQTLTMARLGFSRMSSRSGAKSAVSGVADIKLELDMEMFDKNQQAILDATTEKMDSFGKELRCLGPELKTIVTSTHSSTENKFARVLNGTLPGALQDVKQDILKVLEVRQTRHQGNVDHRFDQLLDSTRVLDSLIKEFQKTEKHSSATIVDNQQKVLRYLCETMVPLIHARSSKEDLEIKTQDIRCAISKNGEVLASFLKLADQKIQERYFAWQKELQDNRKVLEDAFQHTSSEHLHKLCTVIDMLSKAMETSKERNGESDMKLQIAVERLNSIDQHASRQHDEQHAFKKELWSAIGDLGSKIDLPRHETVLRRLDALAEDFKSDHNTTIHTLEALHKHVRDTETNLMCRIDQHEKTVQEMIQGSHKMILDRLERIDERNDTRIEKALEAISSRNEMTMQSMLDKFVKRNEEFTRSHAEKNSAMLVQQLNVVVTQTITENKSSTEHELTTIKEQVVQSGKDICSFVGERNQRIELQRELDSCRSSLRDVQCHLHKTREKVAYLERENEEVGYMVQRLCNRYQSSYSSAGWAAKGAEMEFSGSDSCQVCRPQQRDLKDILTGSVKGIDAAGCLYHENDSVVGRLALGFYGMDQKLIKQNEPEVTELLEALDGAGGKVTGELESTSREEREELLGSFASKLAGCCVNEKGHIVTSKGNMIGFLIEDDSRSLFSDVTYRPDHQRVDSGITIVDGCEDGACNMGRDAHTITKHMLRDVGHISKHMSEEVNHHISLVSEGAH